jgi:predicted Co/Zn/Cd cation transporter (cation efflux family)
VTGVLGGIGVVWGIVGGSQMILLDGVYAIIGIVVSFLLLGASALAAVPPSRGFPYGRAGATPLVIAIQGFVLAATLVYAAVEAVYVIVDGGSDVTAGWGIAYGALATGGSLVVWQWLARRAGSADVLVSEATAWKVSALRGIGMIVGFSILGLLTGSRWDGAAPYVDPVMVLVTCVLFLPAPYRMVRGTVGEMMEAAPGSSVRVPVIEAIEAVIVHHQVAAFIDNASMDRHVRRTRTIYRQRRDRLIDALRAPPRHPRVRHRRRPPPRPCTRRRPSVALK